jgi:hypothetical protein
MEVLPTISGSCEAELCWNSLLFDLVPLPFLIDRLKTRAMDHLISLCQQADDYKPAAVAVEQSQLKSGWAETEIQGNIDQWPPLLWQAESRSPDWNVSSEAIY